jgi:hypothetical protein
MIVKNLIFFPVFLVTYFFKFFFNFVFYFVFYFRILNLERMFSIKKNIFVMDSDYVKKYIFKNVKVFRNK